MYKMKEIKKALKITGPKVVLLDADDVIMDTNSHVLEIYNKEHGTDLSLKHMTDWNLDNCRGIIKKEFLEVFDYPGFYYDLKPFAEAQKGVKVLVEAGFDVRICTAGKFYNVPDKGRAFQRDFPEIDECRYMFQWMKDLNNANFMLDDGLHNLTKTKCLHPFVMDKPWNRVYNHPEAKHLERVYVFDEFVKKVIDITIAESKAQEGDEICYRLKN